MGGGREREREGGGGGRERVRARNIFCNHIIEYFPMQCLEGVLSFNDGYKAEKS